MKKRIAVFVILFSIFNWGYMGVSTRTALGRDAVLKNYTSKCQSFPKTYEKDVNDPYFKNQWIIGFTKSQDAWKIVDQKRQIKVAVVDSGVDYNNPELKNRVLKDLGYNFLNNTKNTMDDYGHGTEVAGIIAAEEGNKIGISGIVGPLDIGIIPVKVLDNRGKGPSDIVSKGIRYAVNVGADIINISIDFDVHDPEIINALNYAKEAGVFVVVAAGNTNTNCDKYSPAGDAGAFTVAAVDQQSKKTYFSSYGSSVSIAAPGVDIITTHTDGSYEDESGTSMSSPIVAGVAAMILAEDPNISANMVAQILTSTASDIMAKGKDKYTGYGLINAYKAVLKVKTME